MVQNKQTSNINTCLQREISVKDHMVYPRNESWYEQSIK